MTTAEKKAEWSRLHPDWNGGQLNRNFNQLIDTLRLQEQRYQFWEQQLGRTFKRDEGVDHITDL